MWEAEAEVAAADMVVETGTTAVADIWRRVEDEKIGMHAIWQLGHWISDLDHHGLNVFYILVLLYFFYQRTE